MKELSILERKAKGIKIEGFIINRKNERIFEYYKNNKIQEKPSKIYSITKSIVSLLIGIALEKGYITTIHEPIYNFFPQIVSSNEVRKKQITIFHLLTMTSGFKVRSFEGSKNWVNSILEQPVEQEPGSTFQYNSGDSHLLSAIISKVSGESTEAFAEKHLFGPLGIKKYSWVSDPQGISGGGFSLFMTIEDMLNIGLLLLNDGRYKNKQIISKDWIKQAQTSYKSIETTANGIYGYGYQMWTFKGNNKHLHIDYYCATGLFGQYIFVVPELALVAVVKSQLKNEDEALPRIYFEELLESQGKIASL